MLPAITREAARRYGDAAAFVGPDGRPLSYVELERRSDAAAVGMTRRGVRPTDVVVLALPATPAYAVTYVAASKLGAVAAGVNPRLTPAEQRALVDLVEPSLTVASVEELEALEAGGGENEAPPPLGADPDRAVAIVFTSGTTGIPKGAVFTDGQLDAIAMIDAGERWGGGDSSVTATSLAHVGFMAKLPWQLRLGGTRFILSKWDADTHLRLIAEHRIPHLGGVPTQVALMLRAPSFADYDLSCVQSIVLGGGPTPVALQREVRDGFGAPVAVRYSCTEIGGCGTGTSFDDPIDETMGVGRPRGPVTVSVVDSDDRPVATGKIGEICFRSPSAMAGYYRDAAATAATFTADGAVRTGDLGYLDEEGRLHLAGRSKEMYIRGGYNVFPAEVEAVLLEHPAVAAVAVVAKPDAVMGERGVAIVVARDPTAPPPTLAELRAFAAPRVSSYKLPDEMKMVDALPLTAMDKVDRRALEREIGA